MCVCEMWEKERERTDETLWENLLQVYLLPFLSSWFHCYLLLLLKKMMFLLGCRCVIPWKKSQHQRNDPWPRFGCRCIVSCRCLWTMRKKTRHYSSSCCSLFIWEAVMSYYSHDSIPITTTFTATTSCTTRLLLVSTDDNECCQAEFFCSSHFLFFPLCCGFNYSFTETHIHTGLRQERICFLSEHNREEGNEKKTSHECEQHIHHVLPLSIVCGIVWKSTRETNQLISEEE